MIKHYTGASIRYTYGIAPYGLIMLSKCYEKDEPSDKPETANQQ